MIILAEERTTLPEGATLSVVRGRHTDECAPGTYLVAARNRESLKMRVDDIQPGSLRQYLDLVVREIHREREAIDKKPGLLKTPPQTIRDFVRHMAHKDMFILDVLQ